MPTRVVKMGSETPAGIRDTSAQDRALDPGSRQRTRRWKLALAGVVLVLAAFLMGPAIGRWFRSETTVSRDRLQLAEVLRGAFVRDVRVQGQVVAAISPTLYSPSSGVITLEVQAGDAVAEGQVLAVVEAPELENSLASEEAALESELVEKERQLIEARQRELENQQAIDLANVRLRAAERELRRAEDSHASQVISEHDYEEAVDGLESARLSHRHALEDAELDRDRLAFESRSQELALERQRLLVQDLHRQVDELTVRSPVSGLVGNLAVEQKEVVRDDQPLVTVVDLTKLEIEVRVPESYGDDLAPGMTVELSQGSETFEGRLAAISPEIENGQVAGRVRFDGEQPPGLKRNQRVTARVVLDAREDVLQVRRGRFYEAGGGRVGYVVRGDLLERRTLETGAVSIDAIEILDGVTAGETMVISDIESFEGAATVYLAN